METKSKAKTTLSVKTKILLLPLKANPDLYNIVLVLRGTGLYIIISSSENIRCGVGSLFRKQILPGKKV